MAKNDLEFRVGADTTSLEQGMKRAQEQMKKLALAESDLSAQFVKGSISSKKYEDGLRSLQARQNTLTKGVYGAAKSMKGLGSSMSANAIPATQEFSRIIQDAPYGIQGVANNIQQLTAQFGYLSSKTGGAKNALKAMIGSLWGPAGILLAVSAVTAALPFLIKAFKGTEDSTEDLKDAVDDLTTAYKRQLEVEKDAKRGLNIQTKIAVAKAKLAGKSERDLLKITNQGVSDRVASLGREINATNKYIDEIVGYRNRAYKIAGDVATTLTEEYDAKITSLVRKNQETQLKIQELGGELILAELNTQLTEKENAHQNSVDKIKKINEGLFRDLPSFSGMGAGTFDNRGGGGFSGMFSGLFDLETPQFVTDAAQATVDAVESGGTQIVESTTKVATLAGQAAQTISNQLAEGLAGVGELIGTLMGGGANDIEISGRKILNTFGKFLGELGKMVIAYGTFQMVIAVMGKNLDPVSAALVIAAGIGLVAVGAAIKQMTKQTSSAAGGVAGGGSSSFQGSSSSATSSNSGSGGTYVFEIEGTKLVGVLSNTLRRNKALGGGNLSFI